MGTNASGTREPDLLFTAALKKALFPMDVAVLWARHAPAIDTLPASRFREVWRTACAHVGALRTLQIDAAEVLLRAEIARLVEPPVTRGGVPDEQDVPLGDAAALLDAALRQAQDVAGVARAWVDLRSRFKDAPKVEQDNAWGLCVTAVSVFFKGATTRKSCETLLRTAIKRLPPDPPEGPGPTAEALGATHETTGEVETIAQEGGAVLLSSAAPAERKAFEELRGKLKSKSDTYGLGASFAARIRALGSLASLGKGLAVARVAAVQGEGEDLARITLEGAIRDWETRNVRRAT